MRTRAYCRDTRTARTAACVRTATTRGSPIVTLGRPIALGIHPGWPGDARPAREPPRARGSRQRIAPVALAEFLDPRPPALGIGADPFEDSRKLGRDRDLAVSEEAARVIYQKQIVSQRECLDAIRTMRERYKKPPMSAADYIASINAKGLRKASSLLETMADQI